MTTVSGHNQIFQQSVIANDLSSQAHSPKPSPDQAVALQQAQEVVQNSTVQGSEESERLKRQKKRRERRLAKKAAKQKKADQEEQMAMDSEGKGRILDTTV